MHGSSLSARPGTLWGLKDIVGCVNVVINQPAGEENSHRGVSPDEVV